MSDFGGGDLAAAPGAAHALVHFPDELRDKCLALGEELALGDVEQWPAGVRAGRAEDAAPIYGDDTIQRYYNPRSPEFGNYLNHARRATAGLSMDVDASELVGITPTPELSAEAERQRAELIGYYVGKSTVKPSGFNDGYATFAAVTPDGHLVFGVGREDVVTKHFASNGYKVNEEPQKMVKGKMVQGPYLDGIDVWQYLHNTWYLSYDSAADSFGDQDLNALMAPGAIPQIEG